MRVRFRFKIYLFSFLIVSASLYSQVSHTVKKADTVYSLSRKYSVGTDQIIKLNKLNSSAGIKIGQELIIKPKNIEKNSDFLRKNKIEVTTPEGWVSYFVTEGDTLYSLSLRYAVSVKNLMAVNNLKDLTIKPEQLLKVPPIKQVIDVKSGDKRFSKKSGKKVDWSSLPSNKGAIISAGNLKWPTKGTIYRVKGKTEGIQIDCQEGAVVESISSGVVYYTGPYRGYGQVAVIQNSSGYFYTYCGNDQLFVRSGERVLSGTKIGTIGVNPHDNRSKMILIVSRGNRIVDPVKAPRH